MKNYVVLCIYMMMAVSIATTADNALLNLKQIEKEIFGKNILDTISLQMSTRDGIDVLLNDLQNMGKEIQNDQQEDKSLTYKLQSDCQSDIYRLTNEISDSNSQISDLNEQLNENGPILIKKKQLLEEKKQSQQTNNHILIQLQEQFEKQSQSYNQERDEHEHAEFVIRKAKEVLQGQFGFRSFLEMKKPSPQSLLEVSVHFYEYSKTNYKRKSWNSFFKLLSSITASTPIQDDNGVIQKIFEVIEELLEKINASLQIESRAFSLIEADYESQRDHLIENVSELTNDIAQLEIEISSLSQTLESAGEQQQHLLQRSNEKQTELEIRNHYCQEQQHQYENRQTQRTSELEIIHQVIDIINSQLSVLKQYISERVD